MRVVVAGDALDAAASAPWIVHELLSFACHGRHLVSFDPPSALDRCLETFTVATREAYRRAIDLAARASASLPADAATVRVELTDHPRWEDPVAVLPLFEALAVLPEPLAILLENSANDWSFLLGIMRTSERERVQRAAAQGWAGALHGGGSTLENQLQARLGVPARGLRTFVVFDSDRLHPDELNEGWTPERPPHRPAACQAYEWEQLTRIRLPQRYWRLERRFIESYMPTAELTLGQSAQTPPGAADAFGRMTSRQRWYFNMKKGFAGDERRDDADRSRDLFAGVDPADRAALNRGFGDRLANHYTDAKASDFDWDPDARQEASVAIPRLVRLL